LSATATDLSWFSLARQPQEPLAPGGATLAGRDLVKWRERFRPLLRYLAKREVVLALSGGGMSMPSHVSTLRVLELLDVHPTHIYGTSAGAVIGGLRAAGLSTADLESVMLDITSADELFGFASRHPALRLVTGAIRRTFIRPTLDDAGIYSLNRVEDYVEQTLRKYIGRVPTMGELNLPFSCIAMDIGTGRKDDAGKDTVRKVVFSRAATPDVPLSDAIGASMSIPGIITPKKIGGRYHIDGASIEHLPVATAHGEWLSRRRRFGRPLAIVAVDLGYSGDTLPEEDLVDPIDLVIYSRRVQERAITFYNLQNCHRPKRGSSVILVRPKTLPAELHEVEKIPMLLHAAYEEAVTLLGGPGFLDETMSALSRAATFLAQRGRP
jgi:predicted acylesterase/phospholipase RssA